MEAGDEEKKEYEARLKRRLDVLQKQLEDGKVKFAAGLETIESLKKVRRLPDGSVDLATVDGYVRSLALAVTVMHDREEMKKEISLAEIQSQYFTFIENNFGEFYKEMVKHKATPHQFAQFISRNEKVAKGLSVDLPGFIEVIEEFWAGVADVAYVHVEDMHNKLKGVFGGDLFPSSEENIASTCGLYTDTLILPDPFMRTKEIFPLLAEERKAYFLFKHGLSLLQYKDLANASISVPIVVVLPDRTAIEKEEKDFIYRLGQQDALIHAEKVFGRNFGSYEELMHFANELDSVDKAISAIRDPSRVLFDSEWEGTLQEKLERMMQDRDFGSSHFSIPGRLVASYGVARMGISNEVLMKSRRLHGVPIIDAPTSWQYFVWKLEYDAGQAEREAGAKDLHVVRGLQALAENEMQWLGNIPPNALIELRKNGAITEIRSILEKGVADLAAVRPDNFYRTSDKIFDNIQVAFDMHRKRIRELSEKKWKFAGSDIGSWLVTGTLAVTAAATGQAAWGLAAVATDQLLDAPKLKDIPQSIKNLAIETQKVKKSPVGMLFDLAKKK